MEAIHGRVKIQRIPGALRPVRHFGVVIHHSVVDGRLRFLNRFSGLVNRDLVLLGRFRVLGQIRILDGVLHLRDSCDALATSISDLRGQLLGLLIHQIQRLDHFERVVGLLLGVLLRNLLRDFLRISCGTSCWFLNVFLSPSSVVASQICGFQRTSATM